MENMFTTTDDLPYNSIADGLDYHDTGKVA